MLYSYAHNLFVQVSVDIAPVPDCVKFGFHCRGRRAEASSLSLWTHPVIVNGPLGVVSAAELLVVVLFLCYFIWAFVNYMIVDFETALTYDNV